MCIFRFLAVLGLWLSGLVIYGQDTSYARQVVDRLCDKKMHGRGYVRRGDLKAAEYIRKQFEADGLRPLGIDFFQSFPVNLNTFPGSMKIALNKRRLIPGRDFLVDPASPGLQGNYTPVYMSASDALNDISDSFLVKLRNKILIVDARSIVSDKPEQKRLWNEWKNRQRFENPFALLGLIEVTGERLVFGTSAQLSVIPCITIKADAFHGPVNSLDIHIENKYIREYKTRNVAGFVPGTVCPDSFLVYTAHYDHLGTMGKNTYFPGANDNASGTAMLLGLARYFSKHPQRFSVVFIGFTGEEAGLLGSGFFADHPLVSLSHVKFLINLDLVGTGIDGITVVNASEFPDQFNLLSDLNDSGRFLINIKKRGKACNSDHCPFYAKGVPSFFIYTLGGIAAYHDLDDRPETLPLTAFEGLTRLLIAFGEKQ